MTTTMTKTVVFDIDGTLADLEHRRKLVTQKPKDFVKFAAEAPNDTPFEHMRWLHNVIAAQSDVEIVYCTGRLESDHQATRDWLVKHGFHGGGTHLMYMRPVEDKFIPDSEVKREVLTMLHNVGREIVMVFDDRNKVVDMWRSAGIPCAQVAYGDF
jgi:phosphoglycolate phosphatase-like HAD superfamily hydrolase